MYKTDYLPTERQRGLHLNIFIITLSIYLILRWFLSLVLLIADISSSLVNMFVVS